MIEWVKYMQNRQIDMLRTAMPYASPSFRKPLQIYIQARELTDYIRNGNESADVEACGIGNVGDVEGLMESLRQFCNVEEREMIDTVLNIVRAQKMYQCYRGYMAANASNASGGKKSSGPGMLDFLMSQLTPEQQNMFAQMSSAMSVE